MQPKGGHLFGYINSNLFRCYIANALTLGLYGAIYVVFRAGHIGSLAGIRYPGPALSVLFTVLSLGLYPAIMLSVLAFNLGKLNSNNLGIKVLLLNIGSAVTAFMSGGLLLVISVVLWAHAFWLVVEAEGAATIAKTHNNSLKPTPYGAA
jgi:hypothetical protein